STLLTHHSLADLETGGAIDIAVVNANFTATLGTHVTLGKDTLTSTSAVGVGTYTVGVANTEADVTTYGLAAVGVSSAHQTLTSKPNVNVIAGENVFLTAFTGNPTPSVDATGHGFELGFIPVTGGDGKSTTNTSSSLIDDATVTAGFFNTISIVIPNCQDTG